MANVKISNLTAATTPVAGTEVLPIVQSGATVKVSIANLTAGRSVSATGLALAGSTSGTVTLAAKAVAGSTTFRLPAADGTSNQAMVTDGSGNLSFATIAATPGGSTTQVQYNNAGAFAGSANLTFNGTTFQSTGAANFATTSGNIGLGVAVPTQDIEASGTFRVQASATGGTGVGIETFAAGATAYFTSYNRTTSAYAPLALTGSTLSITGTTTVSGDSILSGTVKGASTISVGNATPSASGAGITFPATQSASTDANTLDDYEEGTWTPNQGSGLTVVGTFSSAGTYTKIGNLVYVRGYVQGATNISVGAGGVISTNLPFSNATDACGGNATSYNVNVTSGIYIGAGTTFNATSAVAASLQVIFGFTYRV